MSEEELKAFRNLTTFSTKYIVNKKASSKNDIMTMFIYIAKLEVELEHKDKEIERLKNKVEELMELYTTEREVKEDYKSIIKEVREYIDRRDIEWGSEEHNHVLEILDKKLGI